MPDKIRVGIVGNVNSTRITFQKLIQHDVNVVLCLALDPSVSKNVSGYYDISKLAKESSIPCHYFKKINSEEIVLQVKNANLDLLFVVGFSQLIKKEIIDLPKLGCIGFHPTKLPVGRGRAPVAWIIIDKIPTAATFFLIDEGTDSGNIIIQEDYIVTEYDYARDVIGKIANAIEKGLDKLLPDLKYGNFNPIPQDHSMATYYGKRTEQDGYIDWNWPSKKIYDIIRAASEPHPGAFTFLNTNKIKITKVSLAENVNYKGTVGSILYKDLNKGLMVQANDGIVWIKEIENISLADFKVGQRFICYQQFLLNNLLLQTKKDN